MDHDSCTLLSTLHGLPTAARALLTHASSQRVWALHGGMGAGKTTLTGALCAQLGVQDCVSSPTYAMVQEYATATGEPVYHFDFYRLRDEEEALALDCLAYFDSGHYCFIEWPSRIPHLLPPVHYSVRLLPTNTCEAAKSCVKLRASLHNSLNSHEKDLSALQQETQK